ncbi:hypothetical protein [Pseudoalteromonas luteoviolacea]|uniref:DUF423 domain-containing protein n=1 Tax=Pseudoalteromonas luteoviolacea NCIMB 1942 TaxID=1365253 RepID=A0A167GL65_9GAMM|nr:hypothetical protein [Pseudoalteromonas luteoviolacea]KZN55784.1 hypothetical protein N482_04740 [Pseudoalteromonas luteoviolacea NCIMB 1942]KZX02047.1 hypothetical protein JL49_02585 [Pseudoalteromonas luteoviolacea]
MNIWILSAGALALLTTAVHIFAGQVDPVRAFLRCNLEEVPKATLLACWHIVSVVLLFCGVILSLVGWYAASQFYLAVLLIGALYVLFAMVFAFVGAYFFKANALIKLPQWCLLLPVGLLAICGSYTALPPAL